MIATSLTGDDLPEDRELGQRGRTKTVYSFFFEKQEPPEQSHYGCIKEMKRDRMKREAEDRKHLIGIEAPYLEQCDILPDYEYPIQPDEYMNQPHEDDDFNVVWVSQEFRDAIAPKPIPFTAENDIKRMEYGETIYLKADSLPWETVDRTVAIYRHSIYVPWYNYAAKRAGEIRKVNKKGYMPHLWGYVPGKYPVNRYYSVHIERPKKCYEMGRLWSGNPSHLNNKYGRNNQREEIAFQLPVRFYKESWISKEEYRVSGRSKRMGIYSYLRSLGVELPEREWENKPKIKKPSPQRIRTHYMEFQVLTAIRDHPGSSTSQLLTILKTEFKENYKLNGKRNPWTQQKLNGDKDPILTRLVEKGKVRMQRSINGINTYYII